ncbi:Nonribosomal peptide synthetase sidC [Fulvia fulva]|nr:Nonribosomal peptide synthetase sidC [Fulvia fulva]WPV21456.1 Nonribosomal peptide synthetase sidC [Fulvia fulva]
MTSPSTPIRPTPFPRLDTLSTDLRQAQDDRSLKRQYQRRQHSYASNVAAQPKGKTALLQDFSRFVASFTGEAEVCYQFALRTSSVVKPDIVQAAVVAYTNDETSDDGQTQECLLDVGRSSTDGLDFDFGFELLADPDVFDSINLAPTLTAPLVVQYHATQLSLVMVYDTQHLDDYFADIAWQILVDQLSGNADGVKLSTNHASVLNHPPLMHPPPLAQSGRGTLPVGLLHAGFQRSAARCPERSALHFQTSSSSGTLVDETFTYAQLDNLTTSLALQLRDTIKARPEDPTVVPAYMSNSAAFYVSWLAVLKAGFAFCPLPVGAPPEQLRGIVEEVGASLILTNGPQVGGRPWDAWYCDDDELATCLDVKEFLRSLSHDPETRRQSLPEVQESDLAYVMYTSGSTGKPKGVKIHHHAAACSIGSHCKHIPASFFKDGFRWFQFAAPTFDPSIMEIFTTWSTGGTLCGAPRDVLLTDPERAINQLSATIMMATPSMASVLRPEKVPTLRHLWTMGEKLTPKVIKNFSYDSPDNSPVDSHTPKLQIARRLLNAYGPTEGAINCNIVANFSHDERGSIIGQPVDTCSILILRPDRRKAVPVPMGFSGELAIGGPQVSQGYLNRPEQTAAAFVTSSTYGRLYRTGDRARIVKTKNGELTVEFLGRLTTDQVKLSGRRVELGQIESTIAGVPGVTDAVAIVHQHGAVGQGSEQIVVCMVADGVKAGDDLIDDARKAAEKSLAQFMRPTRYFVLPTMPRSRSGKTDRKALTGIVNEMWETTSDGSRRSSDSGYDTGLAQSVADNAMLGLVVDIIAKVCDVDTVHITPGTQLLSLGLDSLRAVRLLQQLRDKGISHLNVARVASSKTVSGLANACAGVGDADSTPSTIEQIDWRLRLADFSKQHLHTCAGQLSIPASDVDRVLPTTATQSGMIASFLRSMSRQPPSSTRKRYINHSIYHQAADVDVTKLQQAWHTALSRADILRTVFTSADDELAPFAQCVLTPSADLAAVQVHQYTCDFSPDWDSTVEQAQADAEAAIGLEKPPFRIAVIQSAQRTCYLLSLFHGIFDGGLLELILQDVEDFYFDRPLQSRSQIDVAVRKHFSGANGESVKHWKFIFEDFEPVPFPCVSASKPETQTPDVQVAEVIGTTTLDQIAQASKAASVSPLSILQAAWATVLLAYTGSSADVSFGSVVSDRMEEDLSSCAAPTFAVVPSRVLHHDSAASSIREMLSNLTSKNVDALPYHHLPLSSLTTAEGTLPYDTLLAFQAFDKSAGESSLWSSVDYPAMEHDFAVMIEVWPTASGPLRLRGTYTHDHLDRLAAGTMLRQLDNVVTFLCNNPNQPFHDARYAVDSRLQSQIPSALGASQQLPEAEQLLHHAFLQHVVTRPHAPALLFKQSTDDSQPDIEWSYSKLHNMARSLATNLLDGYGPLKNEPVMICMEKSAELYVAVLGVLLAGAGWCPIDPYSPPARQRAIMERTSSRLLLISPTASNVAADAMPDGVSQLLVDINILEAQAAKAEYRDLPVEGHPDDLAYLIFTSGTTGLPKGVPITHRSGATAMNALTEVIPSDVKGGQVRCMQFSQYTFDVFVQDLFYTWKLGGTVISSTRQLMIQNFSDLANDTKATHAHLTPAFSATLARSSIKTLEVVTMIGEKLTEAVAADWGTDMRAFNTYGPAEVTVVSTLRQFTGKQDPYHSSNVGVPLPSVGTYVVDSDNNVVMRGAIGELALSGPQLSPGYWKLPEVNAKKFIWNDKFQERLYLTGDLVRHLADGTLSFVGRNDDLVKLGGIRVELGEIAFALQDADHRIEKFEVLHCERQDADEKLVVAFLACPSLGASSDTVQAISSPAARDLAHIAREYGRKVLPPYMLPTTFIVLPRIPRTASAKVDRAAMTAVYHSLDLATWDSNGLEDSTSNDQHLVWREANRELLQVIANGLRVTSDSLHPASSLPTIGIDSIGAIRLIPKINALGYNLSVVDAFKCRKLSDLCELANASAVPRSDKNEPYPDRILESFHARYYSTTSAYLEQDDITVTPTTVLQEGLLSESFKDAGAYWSSHLFSLEPNIDLVKLKRAWTKVARQTEALRAGFVAKAMLPISSDAQSGDGLSYLQVVYDEPEIGWTEHQSVAFIEDAARTRVTEVAQYHHQQLFRLPPWAIDLFFAYDGTTKMMITIHHSIYDGPSLSFLEQDVQAAYQRVSKTQQRLPLTEAVASQSAVDADSDGVVNFWKEALKEFHVGPEEQSATDSGSAKLQHRIQYLRGSTTFTDLRAAAKKLGLTSIVTIFRTAWALVLGDLLETAQVLFAEILSDRIVDSKLENVIGPMMSTVPSMFVRKDTVAMTLTEYDSFAKKAWENRNIRPGTIKALMKRGPSSQVYPAMFAFHPAVGDDNGHSHRLWQRLPDVTQIEVEHPYAFNVWQDAEDTARFELAVADHIMNEGEQGLLLRQLDALIGTLAKTSDVPLAALTETLSRELLSISTPRKDTQCPSPYGPTHYVEHFAEIHPEWKGAEIALKIDFDETLTESWTYAELNDKSNRIAHWILQHGASNRTMGMCLGRTLVSYAVLLGIMKSGNCYLPIDESLPAERKAFLLEDSSAAMVFATQDVFEGVRFPKFCRLVDPENNHFSQSLTNMSAKNPEIAADPRDNCYLLYTSGSTGKPKGVLVNRGNLASFVEAQSEFICDVTTTEEVAGRGKYMGLASRAFDVHLGEAFLAWRHGLAALTAPRSTLLDDLALALSSLHITHASFVPSLLDQTGLTPEDAPDLVFLSVGGEKMSPKTKKLWGGHGRVGLINAYGPTEATIGCCSNRLFPDSNTNDIGIPLGDSQAHVLIPGTDHYALRGMPGELCFTGSLIANGYLNRPDAKGFVEDFHGQRMYRTGDIVKLGIDNHVYFLGRKDDQVKIRGQRVELGEVAEGVRTASNDPIDVATLVVKHPELSRVQLVAFIARTKAPKEKSQDPPEIVHAQLQETNSTLRAACQKTLPSSTVPDLIIPLAYIPLAATSAKADNKMLIQIFSSTSINDLMPRSSAGQSPDAVNRAMTDVETEILGIVSSVLKDKPSHVTPGSTLFELGIDSLSGISVFSKLRAAGYDCSVGMVMKNPTLEQLAQSGRQDTTDDNRRVEDVRKKLTEIEHAFLEGGEVGIVSNNIAAVRPCLPLQEVLVAQSMHQSLDGSDGAYVNHRRFGLGSGIDIDRLQAAWARLIYDNDILRTCFSTQNDGFLQIVLKPDAFGLQWEDTRLSHDFGIDDLQRQIGRDIVSNLTTVPPMRLRVVQLQDHELILLLSIHHALYDGISLEMMMHDVRSFYEGTLPQPRPSVLPFIEYLAGQDEDRQKEHWITLLHDWQHAPLLSESAVKFVTLQTSERTFSRKLSDLEGDATKLNVTFATLLQFGFASSMAQIVRTHDFIYGNVLSGRAVSVRDVDRVMAPCITTIPQRIKLEDPDAQVIDALTALQNANSESLEHQHVSPRSIQKWTGADRALYDCLFSFVRLQPATGPTATFLKEQGSDIGVDYPLAVEFEADPMGDKLVVRAGFTEAFGPSSSAELLLEKIEILVDAIVQQNSLTVGSLGIPIAGAKRNVKASETYDESTWLPLEEQVRSLISQYTSVPEHDIHKDTAFIHMGIDSISAIRFAKHLRTQGLKVSSADVVRHDRLGALCKHIGSSADQSPSNVVEPSAAQSEDPIAAVLASNGVTGIDRATQCYECTPLQSGMLAQSLATEGALYMHHHATRCDPNIDLNRLRLAWNSLVADLDILRTSFHYLPGEKVPWAAVVRPTVSSSWKEIEVANAHEHWLDLSRKSDFVERIQSNTPLASALMLRSKDSPVLVLTLHHAVYDGISLAMLYRHLAMRYHGNEAPQTTPFYEAARAVTRNAKAAASFWTDHVRDYTGAPLYATSEEPTYTLAERRVAHDMQLLENQCRKADLDIKDVCVAAFGKAMACLYGSRDVVFGQVMAARHGIAGDDNEVIGPMFNTVPFRVTIKDQLMTNSDVANQVHAVHAKSLEYQHAPLAEIQKKWRATASDPRAQLIDSIFVYSKIEKQASQGLEVFGQPLEADKSPVPSEYRLNFEVEHTQDGMVARALSSMSLAEINILLDHFKGAVTDIISQPARFATADPDQLRSLPAETKSATPSIDSFNQVAVARFADVIRTAMSEVAQVPKDKIALDSSIYSFGIDSIAAIQIVSCCKNAGVRLSVADILKGAMPGRICEIVHNKKTKRANANDEPKAAELVTPEEVEAAITKLSFSKDAVEDVLPCLPGQYYHLVSWLHSGRTLYEPGWSYRSTSSLDTDRLEAAWHTLRRRNAVLRTMFVALGPERALQVVLKSTAVQDDAFVVHEDRSGISLEDVVKSRAHSEARNPSDFFSLPIRLRLIKTADGDAVMIYVHHSLYDAWSMPRLVAELASIYNGIEAEQGPPFAQLVRHTLTSNDKSEEHKFWQESMAGREKAIIPSASSPADELDRRQSFAMVEGTKADVASLERVCATHSISPHHVVLVVFARVLARATSTSSPLFGFFQLGRSAAFDNIDKVTGPCVNTLPLGLISVLSRGVLELARELQQLLGARVPFEQTDLRTTLNAFDPTATQLPFNTHVNLLWHKSSSVGSVAEDDLFKPLAIGVPTDYSSPRVLPGQTAVDSLDTTLLPPGQLFVDVGPGEKGIIFGARADAALMDATGIQDFVGRIEDELLACMSELRGGEGHVAERPREENVVHQVHIVSQPNTKQQRQAVPSKLSNEAGDVLVKSE